MERSVLLSSLQSSAVVGLHAALRSSQHFPSVIRPCEELCVVRFCCVFGEVLHGSCTICFRPRQLACRASLTHVVSGPLLSLGIQLLEMRGSDLPYLPRWLCSVTGLASSRCSLLFGRPVFELTSFVFFFSFWAWEFLFPVWLKHTHLLCCF